MSSAEKKGLIFGFFFGLFQLWYWLPEGESLAEMSIPEAGGTIIGSMAVCWLIGRLIHKGERGRGGT